MQEKSTPASDKSVVVNGISKSFGAVTALRDVSLEVGRGEVVAVLGPSGSGKTTLVNILTTLMRPDRGDARVAGYDVVSEPDTVRRSILLTGQQVALGDALSGRKKLIAFGRMHGLTESAARVRAEQLIREFDLTDVADLRVGTYSGGMRQLIEFACGLVLCPEVAILDEPTADLDPGSRQTTWDVVSGFKGLGIATLLTTRHREEADAIGDRTVVMDHGVIIAGRAADQFGQHTGGHHRALVPRDLNGRPGTAEAVGSALRERDKVGLATPSERNVMPAPNDWTTFVDVLSRLNSVITELTDIVQCRTAADDAALALTTSQGNGTAASRHSITVTGISKSFGGVEALRGVSFTVGRGEVVALLGPNGAGKTTMVDILSTLTRPDQGRAMVAGHSVVSQPAGVRRSIMLTGQQVALDDMLTGRENLVLFGRLQGLAKSVARSRAKELLSEFDLDDAADRRVGTYSGGMRRRIDIACGLVVRPEVAFLDEPTTGLDPRSRQTIWDLVTGFKSRGIATLLTTQYLEEADVLSDRIIVIDHGVIVAEGTADQLKERTGGSCCEIVPRHLDDLPVIVEVLGPLLPEQNRAALTTASDRIALPAPDGVNTLVEALSRLNSANIELTDIALRRPSLDDVFLALTRDSTESGVVNGRSVDTPIGSPSSLPRTEVMS